VLSLDYRVSSPAVAAASNLEPSDVSREVRTALFTALIREMNTNRERFEASRRNELLEPLEHPEHVLALSRAVVRLKDPASIPALVSALPTGSLVPHAIAQFGEHAVPAVLEVVTDPDEWYHARSGGLLALRFIVEQQAERPLSRASLDDIRTATASVLQDPPRFTTLWRAIDLAGVLNDPGLKATLQLLTNDPNAIMARGVAAPHLLERTQQRARDALTGVPPKPRPGKKEDR